MLLGGDRDAQRDGPAQDEQGTCPADQPGAEVYRPDGRGSVPIFRPGDDNAKPGYGPPLPTRQCRRPSPSFSGVSF
jgi:hypothetical protein